MSRRMFLVVATGGVATVLLTAFAAAEAKLLGLCVLGSLTYLVLQLETARRQLGDLHRLQAAYGQLDQQAKLIIQTDLELHQIQEELDRRLASLMSLHHLGRQLQVSLRPEEVFSKLDADMVTKFGFSIGLLGLCPSMEALEWRSLIGMQPEAAEAIRSHLRAGPLLKQLLTHAAPSLLDGARATEPSMKKLSDLLGVPSAVIAGIIPHAGPAGLLILGRAAGRAPDPRADQELVAILVNQLAIAVENSALYEESWKSQQDLEQNVRERTHELAEANTKLIQLNKAKSDFVSAVSHELRTPLAAIKGYASLLRSGQFGALTPAQRERLEKMERHTDALTQFINNLLDIARIESGRMTMERRPIPSTEFFNVIHDLIRPQLDSKQLRYTVELGDVAQLTGDPEQLQRVFVNLLSNAIKYTAEGGAVGITLRQEHGVIVAAVNDTGCGIAPQELPDLFQEFYRTSHPMNQQLRGTGLGLALVKRIVEAHHGQMTVRSTPGKGSTFTVRLPAS